MPKTTDILLPSLLLLGTLSLATAQSTNLVSSRRTECPSPRPSIRFFGDPAKPGFPVISGSYSLVLTPPDASPNTTHGIPWNITTVEKTCNMRINISLEKGSRLQINSQLSKITLEYYKWVSLLSGSEERGYLWSPDGNEAMFKIRISLASGNGAVGFFWY